METRADFVRYRAAPFILGVTLLGFTAWLAQTGYQQDFGFGTICCAGSAWISFMLTIGLISAACTGKGIPDRADPPEIGFTRPWDS